MIKNNDLAEQVAVQREIIGNQAKKEVNFKQNENQP